MKLPELVDEEGRSLKLGPEIARGGEGAVFRIRSRQSCVAKLYFSDNSKSAFGPPSKEHQAKLKAAIETANPELRAVAAWPDTTVHSRTGHEVYGFLMPNFGDLDKIHLLYRPQDRKQLFPQLTWDSLILVAASLSEAVATIHRHGHVIGDINESNMLVSKSGDVKLIDCDSFQIRCQGKDYPCNVGIDLYQPPELQGTSLNAKVRSVEHDSFGLAVMIFYLLYMGRHPFAGVWLDKAEFTIDRAIREHRFAFSHTASRRKVAPPPIALSLDHVSSELASMFERAFAPPVNGQYCRPSASDWSGALRRFSGQLRACPKNKFHKVPQHLASCPWCELLTQTSADFFPQNPKKRKKPSIAEQAGVTAPIVKQPRRLQLPMPAPATWRRICAFFFLCVMAFLVHQWFGRGTSSIPINPVLPPPNPTLPPIAIEMKLIPSGEFLMGSSGDDQGVPDTNSDESPLHLVKITKPFLIGVTEVTQFEYETIMRANPSHFSKNSARGQSLSEQNTSQFPVETVTWFDAIEFCNKLSQKEALSPYYSISDARRESDSIISATVSPAGGFGYRLPTEAEWEYACRATTTTAYHFGDNLDIDRANVQRDFTRSVVRIDAHKSRFGLDRTTVVGSYRPNQFGLFQLHGNVGEWCWDWHDAEYYRLFASTAAVNPTGPSNGVERVYRGGSWHQWPWESRSSRRLRATPDKRNSFIGFRLARNADVAVTPIIAEMSGPTPAQSPQLSNEATLNKVPNPNEVTTSNPPSTADLPKAGPPVDFEMKLIPAGEFRMGSPATLAAGSRKYGKVTFEDAGHSPDEAPQHVVRISKPFYMSIYEVTQEQYEQVVGLNPSCFSMGGRLGFRVSDYDTSKFPVEQVTWFDAIEFCNKASLRNHLSEYYLLTNVQRTRHSIVSATVSLVGGPGYRLPTEAEWEYACRANTITPFNTGTTLDFDTANFEGNSPYGTYSYRKSAKGKHLGRPTRSGSYPPNAFGLFEMHGNVCEWCWDWYSDEFYSNFATSAAVDPVGPTWGRSRVLRGGHFNSDGRSTRSAGRNAIRPDLTENSIGFRLARTP